MEKHLMTKTAGKPAALIGLHTHDLTVVTSECVCKMFML